ncbi:uncharacterized protein MELLADRAFT_68615 [Melampsora larici-populina 98AG31]|uniref:Uncharacterized protein n=1 Tax=Melampsora larici-populina (strain 98AG31 / pathotype 3-4-7) TaxID=747676 RepID=F4S7F8_MELLP|nr:uncharacterized protein MELLADRAFT_68615 [Melampsora larici-populina 98AG31]EGF99402.1 hypothetical protein MELLADRAFT_68615 [Melampsora larici-populina 98AG31]
MPTRPPGNRRNQPPSGSQDQSSASKGRFPILTTTVRQRRIAEYQSQAANKRPSNKRAHLDDAEYTNDHNEEEETEPELGQQATTETTETTEITPNRTNYHDLGLEWGHARAKKYLTSLKVPKKTGPQALQSQYELDKTMLCIALKVSRRVLDEGLLEGPVAREPNMYNNYQTYSIVATLTPMPQKGVSEGFRQRNQIVGLMWSTYTESQQEVFTPRLFEHLCVATSKAYALTQTLLGISPSLAIQEPSKDIPKSGLEPLTQQELKIHVPVFKGLVNVQKVARDLHQGRLWRHSGNSTNRSSEQLMKHKIDKVVRQLNVLNNHFNLQFHLLLACWNPDTSTARALFQVEYTSCPRWARMQEKKHLLEFFTFESTKAPSHLRAQSQTPKPQSESAAQQAKKRAELAKALNNLIVPYLRGGYQGKGDAHPKCSNLTETFQKKVFRGDIALNFHRTSDSKVTDLMISKGPSCLTNNEVDAWLNDTKSNDYTIVKSDKTPEKTKKNVKTKKHGNRHALTAEEAALDNEAISESSKCHPTLDPTLQLADAQNQEEITEQN